MKTDWQLTQKKKQKTPHTGNRFKLFSFAQIFGQLESKGVLYTGLAAEAK